MEYLGEAGTVGVFAIFAVLLVREVLQHRDRVAWKNGNGGPERRTTPTPCPLAASMAQQVSEMHRMHTATDADGVAVLPRLALNSREANELLAEIRDGIQNIGTG